MTATNTTPTKFDSQILEAVEAHARGVTTQAVCARLKRTPQELGDAFESLIDSGSVVGLAGVWLSASAYHSVAQSFLQMLADFHAENPSVILAPIDEIAKLTGWNPGSKPLARMVTRLASEGRIYHRNRGARISEFRPVLPKRQRELLDRVKAALEAEPVNSPTPHQISQMLHTPSNAVEEILSLGVDAGEVAQLGDSVFYTAEQLSRLEVRIRELGERELTASFVRDRLATTRKYAIALLSHFCPRHDQ